MMAARMRRMRVLCATCWAVLWWRWRRSLTQRLSRGAPNQATFRPLYDLQQPGAVLLNAGQQGAGKLAPVVIDPYLGRHLRPHQVEGVQFMYDCVMGLRSPAFTGCVLADEMGLGKTLQVITLAWTLLKQGPEGKPVASKVMVVTPATLCHNWAKEVKRWLGMERLQVFMLVAPGDTKDAVMQFKHGSVTKLCITSYETLRKHAADLEGTFDLLVCDEGHRLKAIGGNKTIDALMQLRCPRRVLLTGTPIQNNLQEFYALLSFVAPDLLGTAAAFKCVYATPIARAQERDATQDDKELGASRAAELNRKVAEVVLRRTQVILTKHLPPLTTFVLYCKPTDLQVTVYQHVLRKVLSLMASSSGMADETLGALTALKKLCNHPGLLAGDEAGSATQDKQGGPAAPRSKAAANAAAKAAVRQAQTGDGAGIAKSWVPSGLDLAKQDPTAAGKLVVLGSLLEAIAAAGERVVVVSTSTSALDLIDNLLATPRGLRTVRIDGNTGVGERQAIVDSFNNLGIGQVFFLSTRAGGAGLNLIGANHLVLYDSDWNPAADLQAMARIYRDGQKRPCSVWRLLTTGTLEEKIFQRQIMKGDLASATIASGDGPAAGRHFTQEELRRLFTLSLNTECETRDLLAGHGGASQAAVRWVDLAGLHGGPAAVAAAMEACAVTAHSQAAALRAAAASKAVTAASVIHKSDEAALALASANEHDEATGEGVGQDPAGGTGAGGDEACAAPEGRYGEEEEEAEEAVAGGKAAALAVQQLEDERPGIASKAAAGRAVAACRRRARIASSDDDDAELDD
ncbi:SNF2 family N-terminal domain-containing protein [Haematococcus lacustris]